MKLPTIKYKCFVLLFIFVLINLIMLWIWIYSAHISSPPKPNSQSATSLEDNYFYSWQIPGFAYFNNQILLHVMSMAYAPVKYRRILSPGILFPPVRGLKTHVLIPINALFDEKPFKYSNVYSSLPNITLQLIQDVDLVSDQTKRENDIEFAETLSEIGKFSPNSPNAPKILVANGLSNDEFWKWLYTKFVLKTFVFPFSADVSEAMKKFQYIGPIDYCLKDALKSDPRIRNAVGLHLRTWEADISLVESACDMINGNNPLRGVYKCDLGDNQRDIDTIMWNIDRVSSGSVSDIIISTDDELSPLILGLNDLYGNRVISYEMDNFTKCIDEYFAHLPSNLTDTPPFIRVIADQIRKSGNCSTDRCLLDRVHDFFLKIGFPLIQSELMTHTKFFVGSFFSTFSQVIWLKRGGKNSVFIQSWFQNLLLLFLEFLPILIVLGLIIRVLCVRRRRIQRR